MSRLLIIIYIMFIFQKFEDSINHFNLNFLKDRQEQEYQTFKHNGIYNKVMIKVMIGLTAVFAIVFPFLIHNHFNSGELYYAISGTVTVIVGMSGLCLEIYSNESINMKDYRGVFLNIAIYFSCTFYSSRVLTKPSFLPGYFQIK